METYQNLDANAKKRLESYMKALNSYQLKYEELVKETEDEVDEE